jgi:hypothetical protein
VVADPIWAAVLGYDERPRGPRRPPRPRTDPWAPTNGGGAHNATASTLTSPFHTTKQVGDGNAMEFVAPPGASASFTSPRWRPTSAGDVATAPVIPEQGNVRAANTGRASVYSKALEANTRTCLSSGTRPGQRVHSGLACPSICPSTCAQPLVLPGRRAAERSLLINLRSKSLCNPLHRRDQGDGRRSAIWLALQPKLIIVA